MKIKKLIRFDWAIKKLLRHKANFDILEGFLSVLLSENVTIKQILDSESNKETADDKHNRVDVLVEDSKGELLIIEVQNSKEYDYFHRILFGTSKVITEHIKEGEPYASIKKVISITIAYFDLGQGEDYVYHGVNTFKGIHKGDVLSLADRQKELYKKDNVYQIFPEYWLLKVQKFDDTIEDKLDEWIYFLKNGQVKENFTAKGLNEAKDRLDELKLSEDERIAYKQYLKKLHDIASSNHTKFADTQKLIENAVKETETKKEIEFILKLNDKGLKPKEISNLTDIPLEKIIIIIQKYNTKTNMQNFRSGDGKTTKIGYVNRNNQRCEGTRGKEGNDHMQYSYKIVCQNCNETYGANGSDIFQRKCPNCQGGRSGINY